MKKILRYGYFVSITVFGLISLISLVQPVYGQWSIDPTVNTPVSLAPGLQSFPQLINDGSGGTIIMWFDTRNGTYSPNTDYTNTDIFGQRISATGQNLWTTGGKGIITAKGIQYAPSVISDGAGGAILVWKDNRDGTYLQSNGTWVNSDIYIQRVNANGQEQWMTGGVPIYKDTSSQSFNSAIKIVSDGSGGAIVAWSGLGNSGPGINVQRVSASGQMLWATNADTLGGADIQMVSDGAGGAVIAWSDGRNYSTTSNDIYAQRISAYGQTLWTTNGEPICNDTLSQTHPQLVSDGSGGAIITWADRRNFTTRTENLYAQRINANGQVLWKTNGVLVSTSLNNFDYPRLVSDGLGGAVIAWSDGRNYSTTSDDIYAQRININGQLKWTANGVPVCTTSSDQYFPELVSDGSGGAIITWMDEYRTSLTPYLTTFIENIHAQKINVTGNVMWAKDGVAVSTKGFAHYHTVVADGSGGVVVAWEDDRNNPPDQPWGDIYAERIDQFGNYVGNPTVTDVKDVPGDQGGKVTVSWDASPYDVPTHQLVTGYSIWRGIDRQTPSAPLFKNAPSSGPSSDFTQSIGGNKYRTRTVNGVETTWEWLADVPSHDLKHYSYTAATTSDSSGSGTPYFKYFVSAQTSNSFEYWDSQADSGYSIDNLAPNAPANVMGSAVAGTVKLHWNPNTESDLGGYDVFRGSAPGFNPDTMSTYATVTDTAYTDTRPSSSGTVYYVVRAVDVHGNESPSSNEVSVHLTAVQDNQKEGPADHICPEAELPEPVQSHHGDSLPTGRQESRDPDHLQCARPAGCHVGQLGHESRQLPGTVGCP